MKEVETEVNGVTTTLLVSDEDAKNLDTQGYQRKQAEAEGDTSTDEDRPQTKARKATDNK